MKLQLTNKFLHRVRIHGGEFDSSARAMNRAELGNQFQADLRKFRGSTIERKQMSTKTTFKRVALVAVAALGLSVVAVAPSSAAQTVANAYINCTTGDGGTITPSATTGAECGGVAGASNYVVLTGLSGAGKAYRLAVTGPGTLSNASSTGIVVATDGLSATAASNTTNTVRVNTPTAGTVTITVFAEASTGVYSTTAAETVVITVGATALSGIYAPAKSSVYLVAGETWTATADATTAPTAAKTYTANESSTASIVVKYLDGLGAAVRGDTITATITSGPGTILTGKTSATGVFDSTTALNTLESDNSVGTYTASAHTDAQGLVAFYLFRNGQAGTSVVTLKNAAGTVIGTKSVVFTDTTVATLTAEVLKPTVQGDTTSRTSNVFKLVAKDSNGNAISGSVSITATSGTTTIATPTQVPSAGVEDTATASAAGEMYWGLTPAAAAVSGPVTITFKAGLVTATATVTLSSAVAATFTGGAANTSANGDVVYTFTAKDAKGYAVPEGSVLSNYIASVTSTGTSGSLANQTALTATSKGGVWTTTAVAAPSSTTEITSTFVMTGTKGTANSYLAATLTGISLPVTFSVANPSIDAATDAANEATDAANAATDAALAAADAADAATAAAEDASAAVATLAKSVNTALNSLKKQITALTKLVNKLLKK